MAHKICKEVGHSHITFLLHHRAACRDPLIAEPELHGGIELDSSCCILLLFSDGLYEALESATGTDHVNRDIASMVAAEFAVQATLNGVAQAVVDKVNVIF